MYVKEFCEITKQPRGGYLPIRMWNEERQYPLNIIDEGLSKIMYICQGLVVEYLSIISYRLETDSMPKPVFDKKTVIPDYQCAEENIREWARGLPEFNQRMTTMKRPRISCIRHVQAVDTLSAYKLTRAYRPTSCMAKRIFGETSYVFAVVDVGEGIGLYPWSEVSDKDVNLVDLFWFRRRTVKTPEEQKMLFMKRVARRRRSEIVKDVTQFAGAYKAPDTWLHTPELAVESLRTKVKGLDDDSISAMFKLTLWEVYNPWMRDVNPNDVTPSKTTCDNVRQMVAASVDYLKKNSNGLVHGIYIKKDPISALAWMQMIEGAYDFRTDTKVIDFKTSMHKPSSKHTLQVLVYYLLGTWRPNGEPVFPKTVDTLAIFNPRMNTEWTLNVKDIPQAVIDEVKKLTNLYGTEEDVVADGVQKTLF